MSANYGPHYSGRRRWLAPVRSGSWPGCPGCADATGRDASKCGAGVGKDAVKPLEASGVKTRYPRAWLRGWGRGHTTGGPEAAQPGLRLDRVVMVMIDVIMRGPIGMSSFMESARSFQSYFLARRVWEKFFPYLCTVIWPSPS